MRALRRVAALGVVGVLGAASAARADGAGSAETIDPLASHARIALGGPLLASASSPVAVAPAAGSAPASPVSTGQPCTRNAECGGICDRGICRRVQGVPPLAFRTDRGPDHVSAILPPLFLHTHDDLRGRDALLVGPYLRLRDDSRQSTTHAFAPLWVQHDSPGYKVRVAFPLFWRVESGDEKDTVLFPLYFRRHTPDSAADVFFPLVWRFAHPGASTTVVGPAWYKEDRDSFSVGLAPLLGFGRGPERRHVWIGPLAFYHGSDDKAGTSRTLFGPFYHDRRADGGWTSMLLPLYFGWRRGGVTRLFAPLFYHGSDDATGYAVDVLGPAFYRRDPNGKLAGLAPVFFFSSRSDGSWQTTLLPLFHAARTADGGTRAVTPLFGWWNHPGSRTGYVGPVYYHAGPTDHGGGLLPLFFFSRDRAADHTTAMVFPLMLWNRTPESSTLAVTPLFWRHTSVETATSVFFPLFFDHQDLGQSRTWGFVPLVFHHANYPERAQSTVVGPVYVHSSPTEHDAVVFPLFWYFHHGSSTTHMLLPFYVRANRETSETTVVLNCYYRKGIGTDEGSWSFHFFPLFNVGRPHPDDVEWGLFGGLIGYSRIGERRALKLGWFYEVQLAPARKAALTPSLALRGRPDLFF
jgi:hypothetical protein